jgi:peptidoglycan hydrolase CwlO-like protein
MWEAEIVAAPLLASTPVRRSGRRRADVERSTGVAETHRRTVLSRSSRSRVVAVACAAALGLIPANAAHATSASDQIASTKRAIESTAERWFAAQNDAARIDASIADVQHRIAEAEATVARTHVIATARAVMMYKSSDVGITSIIGDTALDSARRAHLVDDANAGGNDAIAQLTIAVDNLNVEQKSLEEQRAQKQKVMSEVQAERTALDAQLAQLQSVVRAQAQAALAAERDQVVRHRADPQGGALAASSAPATSGATLDAGGSNAAPPTAPPTTAPAPVVVVSAPADSGRVSPHHNDPFLVCTRARESGGNYAAVSPSGYYGAYQFLPSTWDVTVLREGRDDLVGVLPSRASEYDQDEAAWTLYQWQGKAPWGGRC